MLIWSHSSMLSVLFSTTCRSRSGSRIAALGSVAIRKGWIPRVRAPPPQTTCCPPLPHPSPTPHTPQSVPSHPPHHHPAHRPRHPWSPCLPTPRQRRRWPRPWCCHTCHHIGHRWKGYPHFKSLLVCHRRCTWADWTPRHPPHLSASSPITTSRYLPVNQVRVPRLPPCRPP